MALKFIQRIIFKLWIWNCANHRNINSPNNIKWIKTNLMKSPINAVETLVSTNTIWLAVNYHYLHSTNWKTSQSTTLKVRDSPQNRKRNSNCWCSRSGWSICRWKCLRKSLIWWKWELCSKGIRKDDLCITFPDYLLSIQLWLMIKDA